MVIDNQDAKIKDSPTCTVKVVGQAIPATYNVVSALVINEFNKLGTAKLVFLDGEASISDFPLSNQADFLPGAVISVEAGYNGITTEIYKGVVIKQAVKVSHNKSTFLVVDCKHTAVKMSKVRSSKIYTDQKDSDIFSSLASAHTVNITADDTTVQHKQMVQFNCSDWDFLVTRAEANGLLVWGSSDSLMIRKPELSAAAIMELKFGVNLLEFDAEMDSRFQFDKVTATGWDQSSQQPVAADGSAPAGFSEQGNVNGSDLSTKTGDNAITLRHGAYIDQSELRQWATALQLKYTLSKVRGRARCMGSEKLVPGAMVSLAGVGNRFNGKALISGVRHEFVSGNWLTDVQFGLSPDLFTQRYDVNDVSASGLLSGVHGLQIGVVSQLENDPLSEDRVLVKIPMTDPNVDGVWARQALLDAGNERGTFFRPEIGDEVILAFINGDPRHPVILGMLNSSALPAVIKAKNTNHEKGIVTREKLKVWFNDDKKVITLSTPAGHIVSLDDNQKQIDLKDLNGNEITMGKDGITIKSIKDITLDASSGKITAKAMQAEVTADATTKISGASTEVSASGTMIVKGSMVQIN